MLGCAGEVVDSMGTKSSLWWWLTYIYSGLGPLPPKRRREGIPLCDSAEFVLTDHSQRISVVTKD